MADPVADKSGFLCTYMYTHHDTLVAYVKHFGEKLTGTHHLPKCSLSAQRVGSITLGTDLEYKMKEVALKSSTSKPQVVCVEFDPLLLGYEEVKSRPLGMKVDADSALDTVHLDYNIPPLRIYTFIAPPYSDSARNPNFWWLAHTICPGIVPNWMVPLSWAIVIIAHTGRGACAAILAYKHHMPCHIATAWVGTATIFGFPVLMKLRRLIKQARIESIMGH